MSNRLKNESSPYLLQHAENPVDWYPWSAEAFERAKQEDKPVFLSIGYSTCHWCHVMAHESFENKIIAEILNQNFVSIKVDREERPDVDSVYMSVCQAFTGSGGWPMSVFLTPEQKPFFAGTYFPPESKYGRIGFKDLLLTVAEKWKNDREGLVLSADRILSNLRQKENDSDAKVNERLPKEAVEIFAKSFDPEYGGFGPAPKFPVPHNLIFLMLYGKLNQDPNAFEQAKRTLDCMRRGGIFDQIGYGFSRYSTDRYFLVPHFEKMLYDNALLIIAYAVAYKMSGDVNALDTAEKTAQYVFREMRDESGAFYSAQDADSEGEEGKFYVWSFEEVCEVLEAERGRRFCDYFGITEQGNFEGKNILHLRNENPLADPFEKERQMLYDYRKKRGSLHLDDKILISWNALMICALTVLYRITGKKEYLLAAEKAALFLEHNLMAEGMILYVSYRQGKRQTKGFLDEYAYYLAALLFLYEATAKLHYLERAQQIYHSAERQFADRDGGGYFLCGTENDKLITKPKETYDGALPSGNSVMAYCLVRLFQITGEEEIRLAAERQLAFLSKEAEAYPAGYSMFLIALLTEQNPWKKITIVLAENDCRDEVIKRLPLDAEIKIVQEKTKEYRLLNGKTTCYVCGNGICNPPVNF